MDATPEEWRPLPGWEDFYEISTQGNVRTVSRIVSIGTSWRRIPARVRRQGSLKSGYKIIALSRPGQKATKLVHPLVLEAFIGPRPAGMHACHNDGDNTNNHLTNLRWDTASENHADRFAHGTRPGPNRVSCIHGHPWRNPYVDPRGRKFCRECKREDRRRRRALERI